MSGGCEGGTRKTQTEVLSADTSHQTRTVPQPDRRTTEQTLWGLLTPAAMPCQAEENPAVNVCPSGDGRDGAHTGEQGWDQK